MALPQSMDPELRRQIEAAADRSDTSVDEWIERAVVRGLEREEDEPLSSSDAVKVVESNDAKPHHAGRGDRTGEFRTLLEAALLDRDGMYLPPPGVKPEGSKNPVRLRGGKSMSDTIIEERGERWSSIWTRARS